MKHLRLFAYNLLRILLVLTVATGMALAQDSNSIRGTVTTLGPDGESVFLPGAQISLHCEQVSANETATTTDETGRFSILGLDRASCGLSASMQGFATETKTLEVAGSVEVSLQLKLEKAAEKVTVTGEAERLAATDSAPAEIIKTRTLENAPLATERFTDAIPLLPGVVRGPDGLMNIKGARASESGLLVNSSNVADPTTGEFGFNLPVDVVESVEVLSNPYDAEYGKFTGAVTKVETRSGSDNYRIRFQNFLPRLRERNGHIVGIGGATPRLTLSGPIKKGKAYFMQSLEYRFVRTRVPGLGHLDPALKSDTQLESFDSFTRGDVDLNALNRLTVAFSVFPQKMTYANLDTFNPQPQTPNFRQRGFLLAVSERKIFTSQALLESFFSIKDFDVNIFAANKDFQEFVFRPEENAGSFFNRQDRNSRRYEWQEVYHFRPLTAAGAHQVRAGFTYSRNHVQGDHASRPVLIERSDETLVERIDFAGGTAIERTSTEISVFAQDKWIPNPRFSFDYGVRYDRDSLGDNDNFAPRAGFAVALTSDNRTILRGGAGLFYDKIPLNVGYFEQLQNRQVTRFASDGVTPLVPSLLFPNVIRNGHLDNPYSVAWNADLDRELARNLILRFSYQQRQSREVFLINALEGPAPRLELSNSGRSLYREFQVTARYRFGEANQWVASYVHSSATGDLNDINQFFGNFENPVIRPNQRAPLAFDSPNRFLTWGDFHLPYDLIVSPVLDIHEGFPFSLIDADREFVGPRNRAGRFPTFASLDLAVTKSVRIPFSPLRARVGVRIFNLTDHFNPRSLQNNIDSVPVTFRRECAQFGQFCNSAPFNIRAKFELEF